MIALIMAGGIGTRFWPLSTKKSPKQFLKILGSRSMIKQTVDRILPLISIEDIYIVTNKDQARLVREHLPELPENNIIAEPLGRNTAPCIGFASVILSEKYSKEETMLVLPADHYIGKADKFLQIVDFASKFVKKYKNLLTFGITPTYPATGYGYIETGEKINNQIFSVYKVKKFKEKPDYKTAKSFIDSKNFTWNSGMFMWRIDSIQEAYERYLPEMMHKLTRIKKLIPDDTTKVKEIYKSLEIVPVDIGIMEKANNAAVIPVDIDWNDIGSWQALDAMMQEKDKQNNFIDANSFTIDAKNNYVFSTDKEKPVALIGIEDIIVVESENGLLVCQKEQAQKVKEIVNQLEKQYDKKK